MEYAKKILQLERLSLGSTENEKARCNKFLQGLKLKLRDRISRFPVTSLIEIINTTTNNELIDKIFWTVKCGESQQFKQKEEAIEA